MKISKNIPGLISLMLTCVYSEAQNSWTAKASIPVSALDGATSFSIGTKGYLVTGEVNFAGSTKLWEYDQLTNSWTNKSDFPGTTRIYAVAFSIGDKGYVGTGSSVANGSTLADFWEWDQATDSWTQKTDFAGTRRKFAVGFAADGKGYIGTGWDNTMALKKDFFEFDPSSNTWSAIADFPSIGYSGSAFTINNKGYVCAGFDGIASVFPNDLYEYDAVLNSWLARAPLPASGGLAGSGRDMAFAFSIGNKGYIGAGNYVDSSISFLPLYCHDFWEYDQPSDSWTQRLDFAGGNRQWTTGFGLGTKGYAGTGEAGMNYFNDWWEYSPQTTTDIHVFSIYPDVSINSGENYFMLHCTSSHPEQIEVYNTAGELIYRNASTDKIQIIQSASWNRGIYLLKVSFSNHQVIKKAIRD